MMRTRNNLAEAEATQRIGVGADPAIKVDMQPGKCGGNLALIPRHINGDVDEPDGLAGVRRSDLLEAGQLLLAGTTPGSPEIHHDNLALERGKLACLPIKRLERGIGGTLGA
jgi:hypothetical protein